MISISQLNVTPEDIFNLVLGIIIAACDVYALSRPQLRKNKSATFIVIAWLFLGALFILDAISTIILNVVMNIIGNLLPYYACVALLVGLNYNRKETYNSFILLLLVVFGVLFHISGFLPGLDSVQVEEGVLVFAWSGYFSFFGYATYIISSALILYWGITARLHAPLEIHRAANVFLLGTIFIGFVNVLFYLLAFWFPFLNFISNTFTLVGSLILVFIINKEPKLFYILSFSIYRISVFDHQGHTLFNFDWSKLVFKNSTFTKYLDVLQNVSNDLIKIGGIIDLNFKIGVVIVNETKFITTVLVASRSSTLLRDALINFSEDFEAEFESYLRNSIADPRKYEPTQKLLQKNFSNFPSRMVLNKRQQFYLSKLTQNLSSDVDAKLRQIFPNNDNYEMVREEMAKVPKCAPDTFLKLYEELKDEKEDADDIPKPDKRKKE